MKCEQSFDLKLFQQISNYGVYLQKDNYSPGAKHGLPIDPGIWALVGIALTLFFKSFIEELGKKSASRILDLFNKTKKTRSSETGKLLQNKIGTDITKPFRKDIAIFLEANSNEKERIEYIEILIAWGMPKNKAETLSTDIWVTIKDNLLNGQR